MLLLLYFRRFLKTPAFIVFSLLITTNSFASRSLSLDFADQQDTLAITNTVNCDIMGIENDDLVVIPDNYERCSLIASNLDIDPLKNTIFQVGARFDKLEARGLRIYWTNEIGEEFTREKSIYKSFDLKYLKDKRPYQTVTFDLALNLKWSGNIKEMRFEFDNLSNIFYIDFLKFRKAPLLSLCAPHKKWFGMEKRVVLILLPLILLAFVFVLRILQSFNILLENERGASFYRILILLFSILAGLIFFINANFPFDFFPYLKLTIKGYSILYPMILLFFALILHTIISPSSLINFESTKTFYFLFMLCGVISMKNAESIHDSMIRIVLYFLPTALLLVTINPKFLDLNKIKLVCGFIAFSSLTVSSNGLIEAVFNRNLLFDDLYRAYAPIYIEYIMGLPVSSSFVDPSVLGSFLVLCLPFCLHFMLFERENRFLFLLGILSTATAFICLFFTCSWGSMFSIIVSMFFYIFQNHLRKFLIIAIGLIVIGMVTFLVLLPGYLKYVDRANEIDRIILEENLSMHQIAERFHEDLDQTFYYSMNQRIEGGKMAIQMALKKPFFGIGLGNYDKYFTEHYAGKQMSLWIYTVPDNQFLRSLAENGIFGFIFFTASFAALFTKLVKSVLLKGVEKKAKKLAIAFTASILGFTVNIMGYDGLFWFSPNFCFWFVVALFLSFYALITKQNAS